MPEYTSPKNAENIRYELRPGGMGERLLRTLYELNKLERNPELSSPDLKGVRAGLVWCILKCAVPPGAIDFFEWPLEKKWNETSQLEQNEAVSRMVAYLQTLDTKWQDMMQFAHDKRIQDNPGYELRCRSTANTEFTSYPTTVDEVVNDLEKFTQNFPAEVITITLFEAGPFVVPKPDEENQLSCWHQELEDKPGVMIKWELKDGEAYRFVQGNMIEQVRELLEAGAKKIAVFEHHGPMPASLQ